MRDYKLTTRQAIDAILFALVFGALLFLPELVARYSNVSWKNTLIEAPGVYIYYFILVVGLIIIDRYFIGLFGGPLRKEQAVEVSMRRTAMVVALIPLTVVIIVAVLLI